MQLAIITEMRPESPIYTGGIPSNLEDKLEIERGMLDVDTINSDDLIYFETAANLTGISLRVVAEPGQIYLKRGEKVYASGNTSGPEIAYADVFESELSEPVVEDEVAVSIEKTTDPAKKINHVRFWQFINELTGMT